MIFEKIAALSKAHLKLIDGHIAHNKDNEIKKSLKITYKKMNGRTVKRKIDPHVLRNGLLIGFDHKRQATRSFKLDRFKELEKVAKIRRALRIIQSKVDDVARVYAQKDRDEKRSCFYEAFEKAAYEWNGDNEFVDNRPVADLKKDSDKVNVRREQEGQENGDHDA